MTPNRYTSTGRLMRADTSLTEAQFQQQVIDLGTAVGWRHFHVLRSKGSDTGWPDLVLCRPPELLIVELKAERGKLSDAQRDWLQALEMSGVEIAVWRPSDWPQIKTRLGKPRSGEIHWTGTRLAGERA